MKIEWLTLRPVFPESVRSNLKYLYILILIVVGIFLFEKVDKPNSHDYFNGDSYIKLANAIASFNKNSIQEAVQNGFSLDHESESGITPLIWALMNKKNDSFLYLLELGANPNFVGTSGDSILVYSVLANDEYYLEKLLEFGGNPNFYDSNNKKPLIFYAITPDSLARLKMLVEAGADVDKQDWAGQSPMMDAASINQYEIVHYLLTQGGDFELTNRWDVSIKYFIENNNYSSRGQLQDWREKVINILEDGGMVINEKNELP